MTYLLDTHVVLWWLMDSPELSQRIKRLLGDPEMEVLVSVASFWEINIKTAIGKLEITDHYPELLISDDFQVLDIRLSHTMRLLELPQIHHDPFDRILIAQAISEGVTLISADGKIGQYDLELLKP